MASSYFIVIVHSQIYTIINAGLTTVPSDIPANTVEVNLGQNDIEAIPVDPFTHLIAIQSLELSLNRLTVMPAIESTSNTLEKLHLNGNDISHVPAGYFANFAVLVVLRLSPSLIKELGVGSLRGLIALKRVYLDRGILACIDEYVAAPNDLSSLSRFDAQQSKLSEFPCFAAYNMRKLEVIDIGNSQLSVLRRECMDAIGPGPLDITLNDNQLTSLINMSQIMPAVRFLDVSDNPYLTDFPLVDFSEVANSNLQILKLSGTLFPLFPLIQMRHPLLELHASAAGIVCIPTTRISALTNLQILDLSSNQISSFPDDTCFDTVSDNSILGASGISSTISFNGLRQLNLENNTLRSFPALQSAMNIMILKLSFNQIVGIAYGDVVRLSKLETLELSDNQIMSFLVGSTTPLDFMASLYTLDLSNNVLNWIPDLSSLMAQINLMGNELVGFENYCNMYEINGVCINW